MGSQRMLLLLVAAVIGVMTPAAATAAPPSRGPTSRSLDATCFRLGRLLRSSFRYSVGLSHRQADGSRKQCHGACRPLHA